MDVDVMFLMKLEEIHQRCSGAGKGTVGLGAGFPRNSRVEYDLLMASPLLREMLFGSPRPLMDMANTPERRLKIRFRVARQRPAPPKGPPPRGYQWGRTTRLRVDGLVPEPSDRLVPNMFNRDRFLREPVAEFDGKTYSVRDVIDYAANAAGAIHFGKSETGNREALKELDDALMVGDAGSIVYSLRGIGVVTVEALAPLADLISGRGYVIPTDNTEGPTAS